MVSSRTDVFARRVRDMRQRAVVAVTPVETVRGIIGRMTAERCSAVVVVNDSRQPLGIFTEADATRRVAFRAAGDEAITDVMTSPIATVDEGEYLYVAVARMQRESRRHLPVVDSQGCLTGILDLHDALAQCAKELVDQIQALTQSESIDGLTARKSAQAELARQLASENLPVESIQNLISEMNADTYARIIDMELAAMKAEGLGAPPVDFDVITMGSGARYESMMYPDQDNGFVLADYDERDHAEIDSWFIWLAERMTQSLDTVGIPLCKGFVMATNPLWRKPLADWERQLAYWTEKRSPNLLRHTEIITDLAPVWGSGKHAQRLRDMVMNSLTDNNAVLRGIAGSDNIHGPALTWFGGFITVKDSDEHRGFVDMKHYGTLPVVSGARLMALRSGIAETPTLVRLKHLNDGGFFKHDAYDELVAAYRLSARTLLISQIAEFESGHKVTNYVDPKSLSSRERGDLKRAFKAIRSFYGRIRFEFAGEVF